MRSSFLQKAKGMLLVVLEIIGIGAFIYFVGGMSLRATLVILVLLALVWFRTEQNTASIREVYDLSSAPYTVWIKPKIAKMLFDMGLVSAEWESPYPESGLPPYPWTPLHTLAWWCYGIRAVVLSSEAGGSRLVHWTGPNRYTKRIEYSQRLEFLKFPHPVLKGKLADSDWSPEFFFRSDGAGYHIGIRVLNDWWSTNKERLDKTGIVKNINDSDEDDGGRTRITLAVLPRLVFYPLDFRRQTEKAKMKLREEIKTELPLAGWKVEAPFSPWGERELDINGEANYICNYAEVSLGLLD